MKKLKSEPLRIEIRAIKNSNSKHKIDRGENHEYLNLNESSIPKFI